MKRKGRNKNRRGGGATAPKGRNWHKRIVEQVWPLAGPMCQALGLELIHVEFVAESGGRVLRLYLDKPGGINLDDCAQVSRQASDLLDAGLDEDLEYTLEVSSPGPHRPLGRKEDFERFRGSSARIKTMAPLDGQRNFTGVLQGLSVDQVMLSTGDRTVAIALDNIARAHLVELDGENAC